MLLNGWSQPIFKLAFKRPFPPLDFFARYMFVCSRSEDPLHEILGHVGCAKEGNCAQCRVLSSMPKKAFHWLRCFETAVFSISRCPLQINSNFLINAQYGLGGARFSRREPFTVHFFIERVCLWRTMSSAIDSVSFQNQLVCERCNVVEFDEEFRKENWSRSNWWDLKRMQKALFWKPIKVRCSPFTRKVFVHSFRFVDVNLVSKTKIKTLITERNYETWNFQFSAWLRDAKTEWVAHNCFSGFPELYGVHPENGNLCYPFCYQIERGYFAFRISYCSIKRPNMRQNTVVFCVCQKVRFHPVWSLFPFFRIYFGFLFFKDTAVIC